MIVAFSTAKLWKTQLKINQCTKTRLNAFRSHSWLLSAPFPSLTLQLSASQYTHFPLHTSTHQAWLVCLNLSRFTSSLLCFGSSIYPRIPTALSWQNRTVKPESCHTLWHSIAFVTVTLWSSWNLLQIPCCLEDLFSYNQKICTLYLQEYSVLWTFHINCTTAYTLGSLSGISILAELVQSILSRPLIRQGHLWQPEQAFSLSLLLVFHSRALN